MRKVKYVKVEDVVDLLNKRLEQSSYKNLAVQYEIRVIINKLAELPTADLEPPIVHAHWTTNKDGEPYCSNCNEDPPWDDRGGNWLTEYCPYCGAIMDEEAEHED